MIHNFALITRTRTHETHPNIVFTFNSITCSQCELPTSLYRNCERCTDHVTYSPSKSNLRKTQVLITDLHAHSSYVFKVRANCEKPPPTPLCSVSFWHLNSTLAPSLRDHNDFTNFFPTYKSNWGRPRALTLLPRVTEITLHVSARACTFPSLFPSFTNSADSRWFLEWWAARTSVGHRASVGHQARAAHDLLRVYSPHSKVVPLRARVCAYVRTHAQSYLLILFRVLVVHPFFRARLLLCGGENSSLWAVQNNFAGNILLKIISFYHSSGRAAAAAATSLVFFIPFYRFIPFIKHDLLILKSISSLYLYSTYNKTDINVFNIFQLWLLPQSVHHNQALSHKFVIAT